MDLSSENLKAGTSIWLSISEQVKNALENHGFFLATYDKIASEVKNGLLLALEDLLTEKTETSMETVECFKDLF